MNRQPLRVLHDVLLVRGDQSSVVANPETVLTDGRRVPADAGAVRVDVGAILPDGGRVRVDGGCVPPCAAVNVDDRLPLRHGRESDPADLRVVRLDVSRVRVDGGCVDRLVLGEIRYVSEVTLYVWKKKNGAGTSSGGSIRRI